MVQTTPKPRSQRVNFPGADGNMLAARLDLPDVAPSHFALFAHCFTCSKDSKAATYVARALTEYGFGVLRFDFTGLGGSGGDFGNSGFSGNMADLRAAAAWLAQNHGEVALLIGHSLGGAAVLGMAGELASCRAVASIGAPFDPAHVRAQFAGALADIERDGEADVSIAGRTFKLTKQFVDDLQAQPQAERIRRLGKAVLVMHAPSDSIVNVDNARKIFEAAKHPKSFVSLDDADHLLSGEADARYVADVLAAWASRYMPATATTIETPEPPPDGFVRVSERGTGKFTSTVTTSKHHILADEPASFGGDDLGMTPYQLLQASLGACTVMTLRMVAQRRGWNLTRASVDLQHDKIHASDCADCETQEGKVDRIERVLYLEGDLSPEQRGKLLELADRCPVHRSLHSEVRIDTRLSQGD